jgi:hypothetical protein
VIHAGASQRLRGVFIGVALAACFALPALAAAAPSPAWQIEQRTTPTNLLPGSVAEGGESSSAVPKYRLNVTNVGGEDASGVTVTDTLPAGVKASPLAEPVAQFRDAAGGQVTVPCTVAGQTVSCEVTATITPGQGVAVYIPIAVEVAEPAEVLNEAIATSANAPLASNVLTSKVSSAPPAFEFLPGHGVVASAFDESGGVPAAGSHPFSVDIPAHLPIINPGGKGVQAPLEPLRSLAFELPPGLVVNPLATGARCTRFEFEGATRFPPVSCPPQSQVGRVYIDLLGLEGFVVSLYNLVPEPGVPAELGFGLVNTNIRVRGGVDNAFHLIAASREISSKFPIAGAKAELWGNPSDPRHDRSRGGQGCEETGGCSIEPEARPFLTMPSSCSTAPVLGASATGWLGGTTSATTLLSDAEGNPITISGCNALEFKPAIASKATTNVADSPSGLDFNLHQDLNQQIDGLATANLKDARVTLPPGMTLNTAAASGLQACSSAQIGLQSAVNQTPIRFSQAHQSCPDAAKIGTVEVRTPLIDHPLEGAVYLAKPFDNPFDSLLGIYLAIEDEASGIVATLAGKVESDPTTGQLTTRFTESPDLPLEDVALHLFNGARAALTTPLTCGTKTTTSDLTPWSTPEGANAAPSDSFQTQVAAGGSGNCPSSEANAPNAPAFSAGTISPQAGAYSPFVLKLTRPDGTQRLGAIDTLLPKGLAARFAGIPYCSEAQIAQAQARSNPNQGALEQQSPSCPAASEVGTVEVGAGSGPTPTYVSGHAYLAGPYKGAPLSLAIITPAVAGPFDLGAVVVRTALYVDPETAQGHAVSDPFPAILQGIPLDVRSVSLKLERPGGFTLNPTSCDPMSLTGSATALTGQSAALTSPFQVGGCNALKFSPNLKISLKGGTKRHRFPALKAVLTYPQGNYANIASAQVTLPHGEFLEQSHIGTVCTRVQFAANACPKASIYGKAKAITPLLDKPLEGPVYLRSSSHELPDLVAALNGQIDVDLVGRIDTGKGGGIRNTFEAVPDAPVSKFVLEMKGGKKGLLVNSEDICRRPQRASLAFTAQNGKVSDTTPLIANSCGGKAKKKHSRHGKKGSHSKGSGRGR